SCFQLVFYHHPPCSSEYFETPELPWGFAGMSADVVINGHLHCYDRIIVDCLNYIIGGLGGDVRFGFVHPIEGSMVRYSDDWGALLGFPSETGLRFEFHTVGGKLIDSVTIDRECPPPGQKIRRRAA